VSSKQSISFGSNQNKLKLNLFRLFFGSLCETEKKFWFVSVFRTDIKTTETNRTFSKQTEKISKKRSLLGCPQNNKFFSVRTKKNLNSICFGCFLVCAEAKKNFLWFVPVCFGVSDRYQNNQIKQNLWYGELKRFIF
jgi:hypothetical protein